MKYAIDRYQTRFVNCKGSPTFPQNLLSFGQQMAEITWLMFAYRGMASRHIICFVLSALEMQTFRYY